VTSAKLNLFGKRYRCPEEVRNTKSFMDRIEEEISEISAASYDDEKKLERVMISIENQGMDLYKRLFPDELKRILWEHRDEIKSIFIVSDEEWIPWEIILPYESTEAGTLKDDFWCVKYNFGRWISHFFPQKLIRIRSGAIIACDNNSKLRKVNEEKKKVAAIIANGGINSISCESKYSKVLDLLSDKEINLYHFACETFYDKGSSDDSYLCLLDGNLKARDVGVRNLKLGKPMVFLNACESSITGYAVTGMGGFSKAFVDIGSLAFIGTMWRVPDKYALKFAETYYQNLFYQKLSIGEALKKTREDLRDLPNPVWLAYSLVGNPLAKVR